MSESKARGILRGKFVEISTGHPALEGKTKLDLYEALYMVRRGLLDVADQSGRPIPQEGLIFASPDDRFWQKFVVYEDLRKKGYLLGPSPIPLAFYAKRRGEEVSPTLLYVMLEGRTESFSSLLSVLQAARSTKKDAILAIVDATGGLSYYGAALSRLDKRDRSPCPHQNHEVRQCHTHGFGCSGQRGSGYTRYP
ncbi:MAG: hypothetical protein ACP5UI_00475 [Thermoprotei archaeon]|nr:hypothetical protein [TACK group archaeon]